MKFAQIKSASLIACFTLLSSPVWATDFGQYTTDELHEMRGKMKNAAQEDKNAFRHEWQERMREMPVENRGRYLDRSGKNYSDDDHNEGEYGKSYRHGHDKDDDDDDHHYGHGQDDDSHGQERDESTVKGRGRGNGGGGGRGR